jgi:uncharacterized protein YabN with tetrapyrrole methylase and pyrophosphatase domain
MKPGSLVVVGTGIKAVAQTTQEAVAHMRRADLLLYLVFDPVTEVWLRDLNPTASSLRSSYAVGRPRRETYSELVNRILEPVRRGLRVCWATYGHPGLCAESGHAAVRQARSEGYRAIMLPGVSCDDALFADLGVDPARYGCQHYDATNFVLCDRRFDPHASLILWQIGLLGQADYREVFSSAGLPLLFEMLTATYGPQHVVTLYEAAVYAVCDPVMQHLPLEDLASVDLRWSMTL